MASALSLRYGDSDPFQEAHRIIGKKCQFEFALPESAEGPAMNRSRSGRIGSGRLKVVRSLVASLIATYVAKKRLRGRSGVMRCHRLPPSLDGPSHLSC